MDKDSLRKLLAGLDRKDLITLRAMINGKLGRRVISPEQQKIMQASRKKSLQGIP